MRDAHRNLHSKPLGSIPSELISLLRCGECRAEGRDASVLVSDEGGNVRCDLGHTTPVHDGFVDAFVGARDDLTRRTLDAFGYEWNSFDQIQPEDEVFWGKYTSDIALDDLGEAIALDAGCGKGRFSQFLAPHVRFLVALDASDAVHAAAGNLQEHQNVLVVRADLCRPPLPRQQFDFICCLGVLHHLSDPEAGFRSLCQLLAPDGRMLVYLYSRPEKRGIRAAGLKVARWMRVVTTRSPRSWLRFAAGPIAAALYVFVVIPGRVGDKVRLGRLAGLPLQTYRKQPMRSLWLDTFDRLSAPVEYRYTWAELAPWFDRARLTVESVREDAGFFIVAKRDASGVLDAHVS